MGAHDPTVWYATQVDRSHKEVHHSARGVHLGTYPHPSLDSESPTGPHGYQDPIVPTVERKQPGKSLPVFGPGQRRVCFGSLSASLL